MRSLLKRIIAAQLGVVLGLALLLPIQSQRLANAICANSVPDMYEFVQHIGYTYREVEQVAGFAEYFGFYCTSANIVGFFVDDRGETVIIVNIDGSYYLFKFDAGGQLEELS